MIIIVTTPAEAHLALAPASAVPSAPAASAGLAGRQMTKATFLWLLAFSYGFWHFLNGFCHFVFCFCHFVFGFCHFYMVFGILFMGFGVFCMVFVILCLVFVIVYMTERPPSHGFRPVPSLRGNFRLRDVVLDHRRHRVARRCHASFCLLPPRCAVPKEHRPSTHLCFKGLLPPGGPQPFGPSVPQPPWFSRP